MRKKRGILKRILKITGIVLLTIIILVVGFVVFVLLDNGSRVKYNDSDLLIKKPVLNEQENGYGDLVKINKEIKLSGKNFDLATDMLAGKNWNDGFATQMLSADSQALKDFDLMVLKNEIVDPNFDPTKVDFSYTFVGLRASRQVARLELLKAEQLNKQGKSDEAFDEATKVVKFGDQMEKSRPLISYLVGVAIKNMGADELNNIVDNGNLSTQFLRSHISEVVQYEGSAEGLAESLKVEYTFAKNAMDDLANGSPEAIMAFGSGPSELEKLRFRPSFYFQVNETHKIHSDMMRSLVVQAKSSCQIKNNKMAVIKYGIENNWNGLAHTLRYVTDKNAIGESFVDAIGMGLSGVKEKRCDSEAKFDTLLEKMAK